MEDFGEMAVKFFDEGYNCAEASFKALCAALGIESEIIPQVITGFGGGIGRSNSVCGAVSGAVAAIGLKVNRQGPKDAQGKEQAYVLVNKFMKEIEKELGAIDCTSINGFNLGTDEGYAQFREHNRHGTHCAPAVKKCVQLAISLW